MRSSSHLLRHSTLLCATLWAVSCSTSSLEGPSVDGADGGSFPDAFTSPSPSNTANNTPNAANNTADDAGTPDDTGSAGIPDAAVSADAAADLSVDVGVDADMAPMLAPACAVSCTAPADCVTLTGGLFDEENYACEGGGCRWLGCISDAECEMVVGPDTVCTEGVFAGIRSCLSACTVPTDCAAAGTGSFDADNYACNQGRCEYQGCNNDNECQSFGATYRCAQTNLAYPTCVQSCTTPADCGTGTGAYDADNYACTAGACEYIGCVSDAECQMTNPSFICR